ncbi:uncharacterized protein LOC127435554 [Myxocyprinus asiaticus]|uniref:uncharacterized protein LOC127435554 n=1 Tax=Myxocyprinus asiaticus TaxID=70543 RepID=UPI002222F039|nr:uncharacterized protein LOC127435554 [Myxocyprinus asiaticus]
MRTDCLLCLAALTFCTILTCLPIQEKTIQIGITRDYQRDQNIKTKISSFDYFLTRFCKRMRIHQDSKGAVSLRKRSKDCFSVLEIESNKVVCLDSNKKIYISVDAIKDYCCHKIKGKNSNNALCLCWRGHAMKLVEAYSASELSPPHSNSHEKHIHLRKRSSQHFDPSDPLGSENPRSRTINYHRQNREQTRERSSNVSKETITFYDDPLHVLLSKSPVSPNLRKEKKNKQVAPSEQI